MYTVLIFCLVSWLFWGSNFCFYGHFCCLEPKMTTKMHHRPYPPFHMPKTHMRLIIFDILLMNELCVDWNPLLGVWQSKVWLHDYCMVPNLHCGAVRPREQSCTVDIDTSSCGKPRHSLLLSTTPAAKHLVVMTDSHQKSENSPMPVGLWRAAI